MDEPVELYCDGTEIQVTPYTVLVGMNVQQQGGENRRVANIRMSLEHAKTLAITLKRSLRAAEDRLGQPIGLPPELYNELGISPHEDW